MILDRWVLGLCMGSAAILALLLYAAWLGLHIARRWDFASSSPQQLALERKSELAATVVDVALACSLASLLIFLMTTDQLSGVLAGAMCGVGVFRASSLGLPALLVKMLALLIYTLWRNLHRADLAFEDFPLTRLKFVLLPLLIVPLALIENILQLAFFLDLDPDVITSCCGVTFRLESGAARGLLDALGPVATLVIFLVSLALVGTSGLAALRRRSPALMAIFAAAALAYLPVFVISVTGLFGGYLYGSPAHRCPLCILRGTLGLLGYPVYMALLAGCSQAVGAAVLGRLARLPNSAEDLLAAALRKSRASLILLGASALGISTPAVIWHIVHGASVHG